VFGIGTARFGAVEIFALGFLLSLPAAPSVAAPGWPVASYNPQPYTDDLTLPMPCGGAMVFRPIAVPSPAGPISDVAIPLGSVGSAPGDYNDGEHGAFLAAPFPYKPGLTIFWMGKYTVTQSQFAAMAGNCPAGVVSALPQTDISWFDAIAFTSAWSSWLLKNDPDALPAQGNSKGFIRLPTEAEWEYAARGGVAVQGATYLQNTWVPQNQLGDYAVAGEASSASPSAIGSRKANPLGLYDMLGNVQQWMLDLYQFTRLGRLSGLTGGFVIRGGSYSTPLDALSSAARLEVPPFDPATGQPAKLADTGFRVVIGVATGDDATRAASLSQALIAAANARINPNKMPLEALPGLEADTADPEMREGLNAVGIALNKARANTLHEEIDSAISMTYAIHKIKRDTDTLRVMYTSPEFANMRQDASYQQAMQVLALEQDNLRRLVDAYSGSLQSIVASAPAAAIDQAIATEQNQMTASADPRRVFVPITQSFLDKMAQGSIINDDDLLTAIAAVKVTK
jgi:hypothetical protein